MVELLTRFAVVSKYNPTLAFAEKVMLGSAADPEAIVTFPPNTGALLSTTLPVPVLVVVPVPPRTTGNVPLVIMATSMPPERVDLTTFAAKTMF